MCKSSNAPADAILYGGWARALQVHSRRNLARSGLQLAFPRRFREDMAMLRVILLAALFLTGCSVHGPSLGLAAPPASFAIPDRTLLNGIADRAQTIRDTTQPTSCKGLASQLDRPECEAILPDADVNGQALPADELYADRVPSVLVLATIGTCKDPNCQWPGHPVITSTATAFALTDNGLCVTNRHVFADPTEDDEFMVVGTSRGVVYPIEEVLAATEHDDVAIFRIDTRGDRFVPVPLRAGAPVGTHVAVISHPEQHCFTMTTGAIARRSVRRGDLVGGHSMRRSPPKATPPEMPIEINNPERLTQAIEITAEYALGSSGGPVLDEHGNAVGMVCATDTLYADPDKKSDPQAVVRTCVPAESILHLIVEPKARN